MQKLTDFSSLTLIQIMFKNSVPTPQKPHRVSITDTNWSELFREINT
jgi:hypothetical protein